MANDIWMGRAGPRDIIAVVKSDVDADADADVDADGGPRAQRPTTSAHVARRMIANILQDPALRTADRAARAKELSSEQSRKVRLKEKHRLREEAWGDD